MRLLKFNNEIVDIDETTAIGIDFQAYDVKEPSSRKVATSNKFTIPKTNRNMRMIGFAGNPQSISTMIYNPITCEYWNQNKCLIKNGTARITSISERIECFVFEKSNFWTEMQDFTWTNFQSEFITWMQTEKGLPSATNPFVGTFTDFLDPYFTSTEGIKLPFFFSNLSVYDPLGGSDYLENIDLFYTIYLKYSNNIGGVDILANGGHFCVFCKTIFEFIQYKYDIDLSVIDTTFDYNIFEDAIAAAMYIPLRNLSIQHTTDGFYFLYDDQSSFLPLEIVNSAESKTLYDFVKSFFQHFNCLIDRVNTVDGSEKYIIRRFDDIIHAPIVEMDINNVVSFTPTIDGYNKNNWITFSSVYKEGDKLTNSKKIVCNNKNLDVGSSDSSLFSIDAYVPGSISIPSVATARNMSTEESFSNFTFFVSSGTLVGCVIKSMQEGLEVIALHSMNIALLYSLNSEYLTLASMVSYPKFYVVKKWLTLTELDALVYFARYFVKSLGAYFFLNKIESYNPEKSNEPTKIELIKIP
jgi:hypothetical protein